MAIEKTEPVFVPANKIIITHERAPSLQDVRDDIRALHEEIHALRAMLENTDEVKRAMASAFNE